MIRGGEAKSVPQSRTWAPPEQGLGRMVAGRREPYCPVPAGVPTAEALPAHSRRAPSAGRCPKMRQSLNPLWCPWLRFCFPFSTNKQPQLRPSCLARSVRSLDQPRQLLLGLSRQCDQRRDSALRRKYFGKCEACPFGYRQGLKTNRTTAKPTGPLGRMNKYTPPS